jgi:hypothetical protein
VSRLSRWSPCFLCAALLLASSLHAFTDQASEQATKLAGAKAREWVLKKFETFMGPADRCKSGESYRFKVDHTVVISTCVSGKVQTETEQWSIQSSTASETHILVGDKSYLLKFWEDAKGQFMMLRTMGSSITDPTKDMIFQLAED